MKWVMVHYYFAITILFVLVFLFHSHSTSAYSQLSITNKDNKNQTQNFDQTLDIATDHYNYGIGQDVKILGVLKNNSGLFGNGEVTITLKCDQTKNDTNNWMEKIFKGYVDLVDEIFPSCNQQKPFDNETIYVQNGTFNVNFTETSTAGDYFITAALVSPKNTSDSEGIKIVNYFTYVPFMIPFTISFFSLLGLIFSLIYAGRFAKENKINHATPALETFRFIFISGIALSPILLLIITEVGIGINSPIGLIIQPENKYSLQQNDQQFNQWVIHIGGLQKNNYATGIIFPFYIIAFGLLGGYLRYLYRVYEKGQDSLKEDPVEKRKIDNELDYEEKHFLEHTLAELAEIFIAPLLAIAVYFILFQGNSHTDPYIAAAISFTLGLVTKEVINSLVGFAKGRTGGITTADGSASGKNTADGAVGGGKNTADGAVGGGKNTADGAPFKN